MDERTSPVRLFCNLTHDATGTQTTLNNRNTPISFRLTSTEIYPQPQSSPLAHHEPVFVVRGTEFRVDPRLIVAIAGAETTFGKPV